MTAHPNGQGSETALTREGDVPAPPGWSHERAAGLYDAHGAAAYAVAMTVLGDAHASAGTVEVAFADFGRSVQAEQHLERAVLLQRVYALATSRLPRSDAQPRTRPELINALPPEQREVLVLSLQRVRCAEIAEIHGLPWQIIAMRLHHGLRRYRTLRASAR